MAKYAPGPKKFDINSLVGYWSFFRSPLDASSFRNTASVSGAKLSPGRTLLANQCYSFSNSGDVIVINAAGQYQVDYVTLACWANVSSSSGSCELIVKEFQPSLPYHDYALQMNQGASGRIRFWISIGGAHHVLTFDDASLLDNWHHYGATFDGSTMRIYVDGVQVNSASVSGVIDKHSVDVYIGNNPRMADQLIGKLSEAVIFNEALSAASMLLLAGQFPVKKGVSRGSVFQQSGNSYSIRTRRKPLFKRSERTSKSRVAFTSVQTNIHQATPSELAAFAANSPTFATTNSLGLPVVLSGTQLFTSQNQGLAIQEKPLNFTSSAPVSPPSTGGSSFTRSVGSQQFSINNVLSPVPADWIYLYYMSKAFSVGPEKPNETEIVLLKSLSPGASTVMNMYNEWVARFGSPQNIVGMRTVMSFAQLSISTGQLFFRFWSTQIFVA